MKMFVNNQFAVALLLILSLSGCSSKIDGDVGGPEYSIGFFNATDGHISEARADWQTGGVAKQQEGGVMNAGADAVFHEQPRPIPQKATVSWRTSDTTMHHSDVEVSKLIADPATFSGTVYFKIAADGSVKVVPLTYEEIHRLAFAHKPYP
jgi:hypothetical protein